ncbi:MAG TPA: GNAT family N-acetyltransferase [Solirubrobacteraceae bacterium]|jgi:RimJ/RimL family protein N-acetyltransferase|nr:GNAT family N-acetyltransferase [Solirubrobacteraceae bacterium]
MSGRARIVLPTEPLGEGATVLRPWRESDVATLVALCRDEEITRWTRIPTVYGITAARAWIAESRALVRDGISAPFAIVGAADGELLGSISLMRFTWEHARGEVGYLLGRHARGQGHATRALHLICSWGFATLGLERIDLYAATGNAASQRVAERAGFTREAVLRAFHMQLGMALDMVAFGLLPEELA